MTPREPRADRGHGERAFTLLEMLAVVLITSLVLIGAMTMYRDLLIGSTLAAERTAVARRASLLLDRVARDLEGTVLLEKPDEVDPLAHPWLFLAESRRSREGADRLKFDTRSALPSGPHASDLSVVAYWIEPGERGDLALVRWTSPALPESLDRNFPRPTDEGVQVLASGLAAFGVRFTDEEGAVRNQWDSSTLAQSSKLPASAEIRVALIDPARPEEEPQLYTRQVQLPLRPLDLAKALSGEEDEEDEEDEEGEDCVTVGECLARTQAEWDSFLASRGDAAVLQATADSLSGECWVDAGPSLGGFSPGGCE